MLDRHRCTFPVHHRLHLKDGPTLGAVRIWAGMGQTDLGAGFQALAANVAQAARHCFALAVAMRRSEQRLSLPPSARLDKRLTAGISETRAAADRPPHFGGSSGRIWEREIA